MSTPADRFKEFKEYLAESGEDYDKLSKEDKRAWKETFDKYKILKESQTSASQAGKKMVPNDV